VRNEESSRELKELNEYSAGTEENHGVSQSGYQVIEPLFKIPNINLQQYKYIIL
jgi:hypothetical protein